MDRQAGANDERRGDRPVRSRRGVTPTWPPTVRADAVMRLGGLAGGLFPFHHLTRPRTARTDRM